MLKNGEKISVENKAELAQLVGADNADRFYSGQDWCLMIEEPKMMVYRLGGIVWVKKLWKLPEAGDLVEFSYYRTRIEGTIVEVEMYCGERDYAIYSATTGIVHKMPAHLFEITEQPDTAGRYENVQKAREDYVKRLCQSGAWASVFQNDPTRAEKIFA